MGEIEGGEERFKRKCPTPPFWVSEKDIGI
jgi:hypothetical protein